jgi:hypothetical protein
MLEVTLTFNKGKITHLKAAGHTNYAEIGKDVVCAGASSVIQTAVLGLMHFDSAVKVTRGDGSLEIAIGAKTGEVNAIVTTMHLGLKDLSNQFPRHIIIKEVRK